MDIMWNFIEVSGNLKNQEWPHEPYSLHCTSVRLFRSQKFTIVSTAMPWLQELEQPKVRESKIDPELTALLNSVRFLYLTEDIQITVVQFKVCHQMLCINKEAHSTLHSPTLSGQTLLVRWTPVESGQSPVEFGPTAVIFRSKSSPPDFDRKNTQKSRNELDLFFKQVWLDSTRLWPENDRNYSRILKK